MTKALGTLLVIIACILVFPVVIGIIGGAFGIVFGVLGGVLGAVGGILAGVFGAIFGFFGWIFEGLFGWTWNGFHFFDCNPFTIAALIIVAALVIRARQQRDQKKS